MYICYLCEENVGAFILSYDLNIIVVVIIKCDKMITEKTYVD